MTDKQPSWESGKVISTHHIRDELIKMKDLIEQLINKQKEELNKIKGSDNG